jgi:hypothetical protein
MPVSGGRKVGSRLDLMQGIVSARKGKIASPAFPGAAGRGTRRAGIPARAEAVAAVGGVLDD